MCLTDSVSVMYEGRGYPDTLLQLLGKSIPEKKPAVFTGGVSGYTSFQGLKYFETELLDYKPDIVSVCYGWNDHWQSGNGGQDKLQKPIRFIIVTKLLSKSNILGFVYSKLLKVKQSRYHSVGPRETMRVQPEDYKSNIIRFIELCRNNNIKVILMTAPYLDGGEDWIPVHIEYNNIVRNIAQEKIYC